MPSVGDIEPARPDNGVEVVAPTGVIRGPDDRICFVDARASAADAAGRIWLTVRGPDTLVCIDPLAPDPASTLAVIDSPLVKAPDGVWLGDDGGIWFTNTGANSIGRLDPNAADPEDTIQTFGAPPDVDEPFDIKDGPDGWLWFTNKGANSLGRIFAGHPARP